jgi:hypothetical protein
MALHKFKVGQEVLFHPAKLAMPALSHRYKILRQLPAEAGEFTYRIKAAVEQFERVARESELFVG